ncbi:DMT family transporter [Candidatus Poribacteria bacterium]|nr:DMT family transporter [Candidatus Poribacteria bacterium]
MHTKDKIYMLLSCILFAVMTLFIKLSSPFVPAYELLFFRFIGGAIVCFIIDKNCYKIVKESISMISLRAIYGTIATLTFFYAPYFIPISRLAALHFSYPLFEVIFSFIWIKEQAKKIIYICLPLSFFGIYYVTNPTFSNINIGDILGLLSGIFAGISIIAVRKAREKTSATNIFFYFCILGIIFTCIPLFHKWVTPTTSSIWLILVVVLTGGIGQIFMTYAYRSSGVGEGSIISLSTVIFIDILGFLFLNEQITFRLIFGEAIVMFSVLLLIVKIPKFIYLE